MPVSRLRLLGQVVLVRLRFPLLLAGVLVLIAAWPGLRNRWDRLMRPGSGIDSSVSADSEYWCPMCPGVISTWPAKCPVCHMALVRRKKGEATPLPDGVVARMQFSPYRIQLAGIRTTPAEYLPLAWEATFAGTIESAAGRLRQAIDVPELDIAYLRSGLSAEIRSEAFPERSFAAQVRELGGELAATRTLRVRLEIDDDPEGLRPGMFVTARLRVPLTDLDSARRLVVEDIRDRAALDLALHGLPVFGEPLPGLQSLLVSSGRWALFQRGLTLAIPTTSVIDTGERKVVWVERMAGMFDAIEVTLGRRCGDHYPVLRGLEPGDRVVTAGAFLLDAETRLNPSLAASYFGAGSRPGLGGTSSAGSETLSAEDRQLIARQKICPVTGEPLGSMGVPVRVMIEGKAIFLCCKGCETELRARPTEFLNKLRSK